MPRFCSIRKRAAGMFRPPRTPGDGHLREPILYIANILRAFGATSDGAAPANNASSMSEAPLDSPSVFNFFPPDYNIPGTNLLGPEFDLETTATTLVRANFVNSFVYGSIGAGTTVGFTPYANLAANPNATGSCSIRSMRCCCTTP